MTTENNSINYAALANTINIEDITSDKANRNVLRNLQNNNPEFTTVYIMNERNVADEEMDGYYPVDGEDMGWLGYFIGQNTKLEEICFLDTIDNELFYKEMSCNKSIKEAQFSMCDLLDGEIFSMLCAFLKNNNSLTKIEVEECEFGAGSSIRQLSLAIANCNKSLQRIDLSCNDNDAGDLVDVITSLSMHPQLKELKLYSMDIGGINECTALATLLRCTTTQLQKLDLSDNTIDDNGIEVLVDALVNGNAKLQYLKLNDNHSITSRGWRIVSTLLESPSCKLELLSIEKNNIGFDGLRFFANSLTNNSTLKRLCVSFVPFAADNRMAPFSKLLCDTSSIMNTYLSNHTLQSFALFDSNYSIRGLPNDIRVNFELNKIVDKGGVAMYKILQNHSHFNMQPFFEWEFKVLPIVIKWFERAATRLHDSFEEKTKKMKVSVIYDFIKEFPMLYIEPITRKEIAEYTALEEELHGDEHKAARLEEVQCCKTRAMRRNQAQLEEIRQLKARAMKRLGMN